ncbi:arginine repressor [Enterococcus pallens]|uniref:Arginine repressor n=1 Tax=Enterococcus pallens ATCC BAA-351 TaxID=1158607 RepID=R2PXC5_9ENTE|nr:arginine repressor [Enterococcus pallens]EOH87838.1 arginine repressor [Enterococcus pallens ATCC BAA-351]EOU18052.1 arginine repressor [Enterococcus pallens ATCC BAA-351]OJG82325.1 arginine repressor [Enterococcus pallens]
MRKQERHRLITRLLNEHDIKRQEDFVRVLAGEGVKVTQATISRDIKEMKLIKVPSTNGGYRYSVPLKNEENLSERLNELLQEAFLSTDQMEKMVVLKTLPGNASAAANLIEKFFNKKLFAVLNDDDSVLMIARSEDNAKELYQEISSRSQKE